MKKANRKGFTLAELLIVVAIIGILVAISVPIFKSQLKKARIATNQANARTAKSVALAEYQSDTDLEGEYAMYWYDCSTGKLLSMGSPDDGNSSYIYNEETEGRMSIYNDQIVSISYSAIMGGDVTNLTENDKNDLGKEIYKQWGVKIALKDRTVNGTTYHKGEIMMLVYTVDTSQSVGGFGPTGRH